MNIVTKKTFSKETEGKKKRRRITHTCFACKKRKTKCDRKRPRCGTCVDLGINECKYFESPFSNITSEIPEVNNDSKTVKKLFTRQKVNVEQLWHKKKRVTYYGLTSFRPISEQYSVKKFRDHVSQQRRLWKQQNKDSSRCMVLKYSVGQDSLSECLPSYLDTLGLLQKFFDSIWYQAYPIVCQDTVIEDFISIFSSDGSRIVVSQLDSIKSPRIALILLLVECMMQEDELKGEGVVQRNNGLLDQATSLVLRGDALKYSSLPTLQVLLLLRIHKRFNMRDNDGGDGSSGSILHSICFNMAISMGLHREIDSLYGEEKPETINVLKNIWMCLLHLDCLNSLELGLPLQIGEDFLENFSSDSDYTTTKFIETMRFCVNKSTKKEVFVEDLLACIIEIKAFLRTSEVSSLIETFFRIDPQHCSNLDYKDLVIKFCKIFPVFSILSHYYQILLIDESSFKDESVVEIFKSSVAKYNCLSLVFTGGFFQSLIGTYNLEDYSSWSQLYLFACGLFEMPCRRAVLSSIGLIDGLKTSRYEKKIIHLEMDKILLNHLPEQDIIESFGFDYRDPLVLNQCVSYCTAMIMKVPVVASLRLKSYSFNIIVMQYILFIDSYFKDAQNLSLSRYNVDLVIGDAFSLNPENPHPSSLESTDIGTKRKVFSYDLLFDIEKFMHENLDEALLSEMVWI